MIGSDSADARGAGWIQEPSEESLGGQTVVDDAPVADPAAAAEGGGCGCSTALEGRERVAIHRPEWASGARPRRLLPLLTAEATGRPESMLTGARLGARSHEHNDGGWPAHMVPLRERGAQIRRETLRDIERYLGELTDRVSEAGGVVHRAATADQAASVIEQIARERGVRMVVKSKSMVTEEIHLNSRLEASGIDVVETDLGEYIVQLGDERPAHIVAPAVHLSQADVAERFDALAERTLDEGPASLAGFARQRLRQDFKDADMGVTGVNFAVAETGTLVLLTNEGNARMVTSQPRVHVAVMTMEKVIPRMADLGVLLPLLSHSGTAQKVTVYQTLVTGPRKAGEGDGPEELHLVILDNGRSDIVGGKYEEVLACIRCGACQTACPVFRTVGGGHAYGSAYGGPIGAVLSPLLGEDPIDSQLPFLSSLCGACGDVCPVKIPLPDMLLDLRADYAAGSTPAKRAQRTGWQLWSLAWRSRAGFTASIAAARLGSLVPRRLLTALPGPGRRWTRGRKLPVLGGAGRLRAALRSRNEQGTNDRDSNESNEPGRGPRG